ncbi:uncharacterized protein LOC112086661 [Eutrema salsugineum]|uniref:uncharacterized protein LOC112086661 n=1 Tax=Eutrema salsugineum TaxID=72664 RepID=UPI000CED53AC|nr:uncharacterized protein LOC112086661 [Eutrema salsugineum]
MLQLKPRLAEFLRCEVGDGETASFWFDTWMDLGPLIHFIGERGPRELRIRLEARVIHATRNGEWNLPAARSEETELLQIAISAISPPILSRGSDCFLWRNSAGLFAPRFSSKATWEQIRDHYPAVPWHRVLWFKENVPRWSFTTWLAFLARLPTKDRLRQWGLNVSAECVLCSRGNESHGHLFFDCQFSATVWKRFVEPIRINPPLDISSAASWISNHLHGSNRSHATLVKVILQALVYSIWKERNSRIFKSVFSSPADFCSALDRLIRDRLFSFPASNVNSSSLLQVYFSFIAPPFSFSICLL